MEKLMDGNIQSLAFVGTGSLFIMSFMSNVFSEYIWSLFYLLTDWEEKRERDARGLQKRRRKKKSYDISAGGLWRLAMRGREGEEVEGGGGRRDWGRAGEVKGGVLGLRGLVKAGVEEGCSKQEGMVGGFPWRDSWKELWRRSHCRWRRQVKQGAW